MLTTQRYLRHTSRRPIPPGNVNPSRSVSSMGLQSKPPLPQMNGHGSEHQMGQNQHQHQHQVGNSISRPYSALQYPSGTTSARSDHGEIDSVLKQIRAGTSNISVPIKPQKPKITRIFNADKKQIEYLPQPPDKSLKSKEIFSARPMSAFDNFSSKEQNYKKGQEIFKMTVSNLNKEIQNFMVRDSKEVLESEREQTRRQEASREASREAPREAPRETPKEAPKQPKPEEIYFRQKSGLPNFAGAGDSHSNKKKPIAPVAPIQRKPSDLDLLKSSEMEVEVVQTKVNVVGQKAESIGLGEFFF